MPYLIGIDTGGTFTDAIVSDEEGIITAAKALSTPANYVEGVENALKLAAEKLDIDLRTLLADSIRFAFGTTIATNILVSRSGAKTGLITTVGAEDTHLIGRAMSKWAGLPEAEIKHMAATRKPEPIVPKHLTEAVDERIDWKGSIVCQLNREQLKAAIERLVASGAESIAICFLWSFMNPKHEQEALQALTEAHSSIYCCVSSNVAPVLGEYERFNSTILNAFVGPVTIKFLRFLDQTLKDAGLKPEVHVMEADGGCKFLSEVLPLATMMSGPAGGVVGGKFIGKLLGHENVLTTDVGGTSFDVSLIKQGEYMYSREPVINQWHVSFPIIDVVAIGAGGGSIAWVDPATQILHVGPKSAGSYPGPACYGFGGTEPTVADACCILGYLNPDCFLGGGMKLYPEKAHKAMSKIAEQMGMDVVQAAVAVFNIINAHMADLTRAVTVERGYDPREFVLLAFGGGGPTHAPFYGAELGVKEVIIPPRASTLSALGLAAADLRRTAMRSDPNPIPMDVDRFNARFEELEREVIANLDLDGVKQEDQIIQYALEMRYGLQYHVVRTPIPRKKYSAEDMGFIAETFDRRYESIFGQGSGYAAAGRFVTTFIVQGIGRTQSPLFLKRPEKGADSSSAVKSVRDVFFPKLGKWVNTQVYDFDQLQPGNIIQGPAIVEGADTTVVIPSDQTGRVDTYLNIVIK